MAARLLPNACERKESSVMRNAYRLALIATLLPAFPVCAETLADAVDTAYRHNPQVEADRADTRAAQQRIKQGKAQFGPTISANAAYIFSRRTVILNGATIGREHGWTTSLSATVSQPLFTFGRLTAQRRLYEAGYGSSVASLRADEQDLLANVVIAYTQILRDQKLVAIAQENLALLTDQLDQTSARYRSRYATETDLQQTRNRIFSGQAQLEQAQGNLLASRNTYRNLTGHYPQDLAPLPQLPPLPRTVDDAQATGATASPLIEAARYNLAGARARIAQARGNARPYVSLQGTVQQAPLEYSSDTYREIVAQAQVGVTVPLYSSGLWTAQIREAQQAADSASQTVEQTSREVRENIATYWDQLAAARRAVPAYGRAVGAAQIALDGARQQQLAGQVTSLDVLDTARDLLSSRQSLAQAQAQLYIQHALVLGAMGQLRPETFSPGTPRFNPDSYSPAPYTGLPTGPLVEAIDAIGFDGGFRKSPVAVENDSEAGHDMAPEPDIAPDIAPAPSAQPSTTP